MDQIVDKRIQISDIEDLILSESLVSEPYSDIRSEPSCSCEKCSKLCLYIPGLFDPLGFIHFLVSLAQTSNPMDVFKIFESLIDDFQKDYMFKQSGNISFLRPRTIKEDPGMKAKFNTYSIMAPCIYLDPSKGCLLSNNIRPSECKCSYGCRTPKHNFSKPQISEQWDSPLGRAIVSLYDSVGKKKYKGNFQFGTDTSSDLISFMLSSLNT
jgi:hypothetical protein